jgi:hypothetical protein
MARDQRLQCPFCNNYLIAPVDIKTKTMELTGGICKCGAVYVLDRTGHNLGEIFMDALTFVCKGDIDRALSLAPEDYESVEYDYDLHANTVGRRSKSGKLCKLLFIRLKIREA